MTRPPPKSSTKLASAARPPLGSLPAGTFSSTTARTASSAPRAGRAGLERRGLGGDDLQGQARRRERAREAVLAPAGRDAEHARAAGDAQHAQAPVVLGHAIVARLDEHLVAVQARVEQPV